MTLPLDVWREIISYHPFHFWQLSNSGQVPVSSTCNDIVFEQAYLNADQVGREQIRRAIKVAEARLREHLNYSVGKRWVTETLQYPFPRSYGQQYASSTGGDSRWLTVNASEGYLRNIGAETREALATAKTVAYTDRDEDGLEDTFTITVAGVSSTLDIEQVEVYFASADRLDGEGQSDRWRIAPVFVSLSGTTLTITGRKWLMVKPIKYRGFVKPASLNPSTVANFATTADVSRRYTDPDGQEITNSQATLIWETEPYPSWAYSCVSTPPSFSTNSLDPAAIAQATARAQIRDERLGTVVVGRATFDTETEEWKAISWGNCRQPDRVILRYECGAKVADVEATLNEPEDSGRWPEIVTRLAAAELNGRICGCDVANRELFRWQYELSLRTQGESFNLSERDLNNPFGTRAGAVYAWKQVSNLMVTHAFLPG